MFKQYGNKVLIDEDKEKLLNTLEFMPQYSVDDVKEYIEEEITLGADNCYYLKGFAPLEDLREAKRQEINTARDNAEQGGFEYLGKVFDSDPVSCQRIALASQTAMMAKTAGQEFTVNWTCQDNSTIELDADSMIGASVALTQWSNTCHTKASELKGQLSKATTEDEIKSINW
jgi:hypothetical protein